jgi:hypothetical protein
VRSGPGKRQPRTNPKKKSPVISSEKKWTVMNLILPRMKKHSPSSGQNGQLVHWWLLVHSSPHAEHRWGCRNKCTNLKVGNCKYALQQQRQQFHFSFSSVAVFLRHEGRHDLLQQLYLLLLACLLACCS